ncbi:MAG: arsenate reductase ArsC [Pseudobacteriovorax sp.]|nr:arsenate reductase ArsC [Pseudobacteriovorax sp.]
MNKKILFLCTGNSCRSQMAEALWNKTYGDRCPAVSAGIEAHGINPYAAKVLEEIGIDISGASSNLLDDFDLSEVDRCVTVCSHAHESCPIPPQNVRTVHHPFDDPPSLTKDVIDEEEKLSCYRRVRDEIHQFVVANPNI